MADRYDQHRADWDRRLQAYAEGEGTEAERAALEAFLRRSPEDRARLQELRQEVEARNALRPRRHGFGGDGFAPGGPSGSDSGRRLEPDFDAFDDPADLVAAYPSGGDRGATDRFGLDRIGPERAGRSDGAEALRTARDIAEQTSRRADPGVRSAAPIAAPPEPVSREIDNDPFAEASQSAAMRRAAERRAKETLQKTVSPVSSAKPSIPTLSAPANDTVPTQARGTPEPPVRGRRGERGVKPVQQIAQPSMTPSKASTAALGSGIGSGLGSALGMVARSEAPQPRPAPPPPAPAPIEPPEPSVDDARYDDAPRRSDRAPRAKALREEQADWDAPAEKAPPAPAPSTPPPSTPPPSAPPPSTPPPSAPPPLAPRPSKSAQREAARKTRRQETTAPRRLGAGAALMATLALGSGFYLGYGPLATEPVEALDWRERVAAVVQLETAETIALRQTTPTDARASVVRVGETIKLDLEAALEPPLGLVLQGASALQYGDETLARIDFLTAEGDVAALAIMPRTDSPALGERLAFDTADLVGGTGVEWRSDRHIFLMVGPTTTEALLRYAHMFGREFN